MEDLAARLAAALLTSLRIAPALAFGGPFALLRVPPVVRVLLAMSLAMWLVAGRPDATTAVVKAGYPIPGLAAGELFIGLAVALSLQLAFAAILWAGRAIDIQAGFGLAMIADPATQAQMPLAGTVFAYAAAPSVRSSACAKATRFLYPAVDAFDTFRDAASTRRSEDARMADADSMSPGIETPDHFPSAGGLRCGIGRSNPG